MGASKSNLFTKSQNRLAELAKALAHPARIAILEHLIKNGNCYCGDIVEDMPLSQSTVSQHLKAMKDVGILKIEENGAYNCYCTNLQACIEMKVLLDKVFEKVKNCC